MGNIREPHPVKAFVGVLTARLSVLQNVRELLERQLGPVDLESRLLDFNYTDYYEAEMGPGLKRIFWGFRDLVGPEALVDLKLSTNLIEHSLADSGKRTVNLDPGYLAASRIVLASTKDFAHRVYLGRGIYGEVTLIFQSRSFQPLPWTYPDYRSEPYHRFFKELRSVYMAQLAAYKRFPNDTGPIPE